MSLGGRTVSFFRRIVLAFRLFFRVLLGRPLPPGLAVEGAAATPGAPLPAAGPAAADLSLERTRGAVALLALLQREGRLVDFLREDISDYPDDRVGAAARAVHKGCRRALEEHVALEPVLDAPEGGRVELERGFDPGAVRLVGAVRGEPPFRGTLRHPGWRAARVELPPDGGGVVAPAEVEL
jgi:hypothetical protein